MGNPKPSTGFHTHPERANRKGTKVRTWSETIRHALQEESNGKKIIEIAAAALLREVKKGNIAAIKEMGDRVEGKAPQPLGSIDEKGKFKPQSAHVVWE